MPGNRPGTGKGNRTNHKPNRGSFKPGVSGNPNGRPKSLKEITDLAREAGPDAVKRLIKLSKGKGAVALQAARALLDRGYGRPSQSIQVTGSDNGPIQVRDLSNLSDAELELLKKLAIKNADPASS